MKTICIKTNNFQVINYLLENLKNFKLSNFYFSYHKFKLFNNIIIHYKGEDFDLFLKEISELLTNLVFDIYQDSILNKILQYDYFYFNKNEQIKILEMIPSILDETDNFYETTNSLLFNIFFEFLHDANKVFLHGFITFRLKKYIKELQKIVDMAVNRYLIEKEYTEFISLLKMYVNSEESQIDLVHLIYCNEKPFLLDNNKAVIKTNLNISHAKYLSDISFSSCDIILNALLNLIPKTIYIHLIDTDCDDFITTLKLIFENRIKICTDCTICNVYKNFLKQEIPKST